MESLFVNEILSHKSFWVAVLSVSAIAIFSSGSIFDAYATTTFSGWIGNCNSGTNCDTVNHVTTGFCSNCVVTGSTGSGNGQFYYPRDIAFDSTGNFYVTDSGNTRVEKFNSAGVYQSSFGSSGTANGQFGPITSGYGQYGIALDSSNNIYVSDTNNNRVEKFNSAGTFQGWFGSCVSGTNCNTSTKVTTGFCTDCGVDVIAGNNAGEVSAPAGIAIDSSGNIYVADKINRLVDEFNSAGVYQSSFGSVGSAPGEFNVPLAIAFDSSGNIYVTDAFNARVEKFNSAGVYQSLFGSGGTGNGQFGYAYGIAFDSSGNIYVVDYDNRVEKFNSAGTYLSQIGCATGNCNGGSGNGQFDSPFGVTLDSSGNIYVADFLNNRIEKFLSGTYQTTPLDSLTMSDSVKTVTSYKKSLSDSIAMSDSVKITMPIIDAASPTFGTVGQPVAINFNDLISHIFATVKFDATSISNSTVHTNSTGGWRGTVIVPFGTSLGLQPITVYDGTRTLETPFTVTAPSTPTGVLSTALSPTSIKVSWASSPFTVSYKINRSVSSSGPFVSILGTHLASPFTDIGLGPDRTYYYEIAATNSVGTSAFSSNVSATTLQPAPSAPTSVSGIALTSTSIKVSWHSSPGATSYTIFRLTAGLAATAVGTSTTTSYTDSGLASNTTYYYEVSASNSGGMSAKSIHSPPVRSLPI